MGREQLEQTEALRTRVRELERRVRVLRTSRRVLMTLVSRLESQRREESARHESERGYLRRQNAKYARLILERHQHIYQLERLLAGREIASAGRDDPAGRRNATSDEVNA